jgi:hypothetical protein
MGHRSPFSSFFPIIAKDSPFVKIEFDFFRFFLSRGVAVVTAAVERPPEPANCAALAEDRRARPGMPKFRQKFRQQNQPVPQNPIEK